MKSLDRYLPHIYFTGRMLIVLVSLVLLFALGFAYPLLFAVGQIVLLAFIGAVIYELIIIYSKKEPFAGQRIAEDKLSNGEFNPIIIKLSSSYSYKVFIRIIDEFPVQLQIRNRSFTLGFCEPNFTKELDYEVRPTIRGNYYFGDLRVFVRAGLRIIERRVTVEAEEEMKVYPSFIQLRRFSFYAISDRLDEAGIKKIRQLGSNHEFEQIREYVRGDDFRRINWRATARRGNLMMNEYQEERAQNVYCLLDTGRNMHMPFDGLSLSEYAINATLVLLGVAKAKGDLPGFFSFSKTVNNYLPASNKATHLQSIIESLYKLQTDSLDTDFFELYKYVKQTIKKRSLLLVFTNFNTLSGLNRQLKFLRALARDHLICLIFFENTEISSVAERKVYSLSKAYDQAIAEKYELEKRMISNELQKNGIYSIRTKPDELTINSINQYISFKATGAL